MKTPTCVGTVRVQLGTVLVQAVVPQPQLALLDLLYLLFFALHSGPGRPLGRRPVREAGSMGPEPHFPGVRGCWGQLSRPG